MGTKNPYVDFLRRWYWLLACGLVVAVLATHVALAKRVPLYRSTSTVRIGRALEEPSPNQGNLSVTDRLVSAYAELAKRDLVLKPVIETLRLPFTPDGLRSRMVTAPVASTQLVDISVVDEDPVRAAAIANEIARQLVLQSPDTSKGDNTQEFINGQLADLQAKITDGQSRIVTLQDQIAAMSKASEIADAQQRLNALQAQVNAWQESFAKLVVASEPSPTNQIQQIGTAIPAPAPIPSSTMMYYALAVVLGVGMASLLALGLGMLNNVVAEADDLRELESETPVAPIPRYRVPPRATPIAMVAPGSPATAAYRVLRNSLQANGLESSHFSLAVTSSRSGEGKTTTTANLGITLANAGRKVLLVDANFRNPELGHLFQLDTSIGLSDLLLGDRVLGQVIRPTQHPNLSIIASGTIPPNYLDLLSSQVIDNIVADIATTADIVIFDTPAVSEEQEALLLAKAVGGVLLVAEARHVRTSDLQRALELIRRADARVVSIVLNKASAPRFTRDRLPWSREARLRARAAHWRSESSYARRQAREQEHVSSTAD